MIDFGKRNVLGVMIDVVDYEAAAVRVVRAAEARQPYAVASLAVHGIMTGVDDEAHRYRLNTFDMITPDGQPVRWALNLLSKARLRERVYGPKLMLHVIERAAEQGLPVYFYGSSAEVLEKLGPNLQKRWPALIVAGAQPGQFRHVSAEEKQATINAVRESGARILFVGLGCPRQEIFCYEHRDHLDMPLLAVGAAFDYHAGTVREPPAFVQRWGLQWLYRLVQQPRRLWRRYLILNPRYLGRLFAQRLGLWHPNLAAKPPADEIGWG